MRVRRFSVALLILFSSSTVRGETDIAQLQKRVDQLEQLVSVMERRLESLEGARAPHAEPAK